jgi:hypothetical protein
MLGVEALKVVDTLAWRRQVHPLLRMIPKTPSGQVQAFEGA